MATIMVAGFTYTYVISAYHHLKIVSLIPTGGLRCLIKHNFLNKVVSYMYLQQVCQFPSVSCHNMNETLSKAASSTNKESEGEILAGSCKSFNFKVDFYFQNNIHIYIY
jgi:hypothetical protein